MAEPATPAPEPLQDPASASAPIPALDSAPAQDQAPAPDPAPSSDLPTASAEVVKCCESADAPSQKPCELCKKPACKHCRVLVNGQRVCGECKTKILAELEAEKAPPGALGPAIAAGVLAALFSGAIWAAIAIGANMQIGYVAIGVGWLAGYAVVLAARGKKGQNLQIVAVSCALLGLVAGKYFIMAHTLKPLVAQSLGTEAAEISYFHPLMLKIFPEILPHMLSPFDILWLILALGIAWRTPKPTENKVS